MKVLPAGNAGIYMIGNKSLLHFFFSSSCFSSTLIDGCKNLMWVQVIIEPQLLFGSKTLLIPNFTFLAMSLYKLGVITMDLDLI